jgi:predicted GNAT superfamily acetyltransferase
MPDSQLAVRPLDTIEDFEQAEIVQREIWGMPDGTQVVPLHVLLTAQKNGGLVAGAFTETGEMIGVLFGFIGQTTEGKFKHCSHLMGVLPGSRRQSVGQALKLFQRSYVLAQGFDLVTWTFDPLEGVNASLNIGKLGAISHKYYRDHYGSSMADGLNAGLPTDRFEVEWWIGSQRVRQRVEASQRVSYAQLVEAGAIHLNKLKVDANGVASPEIVVNTTDAATLLIEIPPRFQAIKTASMDLALAWREHTASLFEHYFARDYIVSDFVSERAEHEPPDRQDGQGQRRNFYVLTRSAAIGSADIIE